MKNLVNFIIIPGGNLNKFRIENEILGLRKISSQNLILIIGGQFAEKFKLNSILLCESVKNY